MTQLPQRHSPTQSESGQAAVMMAFMLFLVFLAFAALAIDGAMTYLVRRDLQNVADSATLAACRVIADNDTSGGNTVTTNAMNAAKNAIGSWATQAGTNPPSTNVGADAGLVKGIQISGADVRVALQRNVPTVLTQFVGRGNSIMIAQAHCSSKAAGGLMPIAVRRYDGLSGTMTDYVARQGAPPYGYYLSGGDSVTNTLSPGRYGPYDVPVPCGNPNASPACTPGLDYTASDANPGPAVQILGAGAAPNVGTSSYNNFVSLDVRNIASGNPEYYNGATGVANTDKGLESQWIFKGYPGPYFLPGEQMAILNGGDVSFAPHAMIQAGYKVGDAVAVIVYDGNVWDTPGYQIHVGPNPGSSNGIMAPTVRPTNTTSAISYTVTIAKDGSASWRTALDFNLYFKLSEALPTSGGSCGDGIQMWLADGSNPPASLSVVQTLGPNMFHYTKNSIFADSLAQGTIVWTGTLYVFTTDPTTTVPSCLSGLDMVAVDSQGLDKGTSSHFGFGSLTYPAYTLRSGTSPSSGPGIITVDQGGSVDVSKNLITHPFVSSGNLNCTASVVANVYTTNGSPQTWASFFPAADQNTTVNIKTSGSGDSNPNNYSLHALTTASIGTYLLRFTVTPGGSVTCTNLGVRSLDVPLKILDISTGTSIPSNFVEFQGYAVFRISGFTPNAAMPNTIWGNAISPLYEHLSDITYGLRPRLVPWN